MEAFFASDIKVKQNTHKWILLTGGILISSLISYAIYQKVVQKKGSEKKQ
jgi:hypothetical protein